MGYPAVYQCAICGCTPKIPCADLETGETCHYIETNLCSFCHENNKQEIQNQRHHRFFFREYKKRMSAKNSEEKSEIEEPEPEEDTE